MEKIDKVIVIDQSPIGRTPRSNPATYTKAFGHIRQLFASTPLAKERGYEPGQFSFNVRGGRCEACQGAGSTKLEMNFLPDVWVTCDVCKGKRYTRETLEVEWKGKTIHCRSPSRCFLKTCHSAMQLTTARQQMSPVSAALQAFKRR